MQVMLWFMRDEQSDMDYPIWLIRYGGPEYVEVRWQPSWKA